MRRRHQWLRRVPEVALFNKGSAEIRHDEVTDEQRVVLRHMNKESIDRFSAGNGNECKASPSYGNFGTLADGDIGLEIRNELIFKIVAKSSEILACLGERSPIPDDSCPWRRTLPADSNRGNNGARQYGPSGYELQIPSSRGRSGTRCRRNS